MSSTNAQPATRLGALDEALVGTMGPQITLASSVDLAGFDAIVQFSKHLVQSQVVRSLDEHHLLSLSAYVPWGSIPLPETLVATVSQHVPLTAVPARLELRLVNPRIVDFRWPPDVPVADPPTTGESTAHLVGFERHVDIAWRLEINVLPASRDDPISPRLKLAEGMAVTPAQASVVVDNALWRFKMVLDFSGTSATVTSDAEAATDFLATDAGADMLEQALARLRAGPALDLCPWIVPGGILSFATVQQMGLRPFTVRDRLLEDAHGNSVLSLCVQTSSGGAMSRVRPFLEGRDFTYAVSTGILAPALKTRWKLSTTGLSIVSDIIVDMPVGDDPDVTAPGRARLRITFSPTLDDVSVMAATDGHGDPIRLLGKQTIQLLALWDPDGKRINDLGDLAKPEETPLVIPMRLFGSSDASPGDLQPNFKELMLMLMATIMLPVQNGFPINARSIGGFASSARHMVVVHWNLQRFISGNVQPAGELVQI